MKKEHPGSREMYDTIAAWESSSVVVSSNMRWNRFGILGILGDFVLSYTPGDIIEIGVGESSIFLTELARRYKRMVYHCDICTSDIQNMLTIDGIFGKNKLVYDGRSDDFFKEVPFGPIAFGFIDGDHVYEQVNRDFNNMLPLIVDNGYIFLHDTYPPDEEHLSPHRCGTVYQLRKELEQRGDLDVFTFPNGAMDVGFTMVRKLPKIIPYYQRKFPNYYRHGSSS